MKKKIDEEKAANLISTILSRYDIPLEVLEDALVPEQISIDKISGSVFEMRKTENCTHILPGRTGKIVSKKYAEGKETWKELIKGRITEVKKNKIIGEFYHIQKSVLKKKLESVQKGDIFEIDGFGGSSKIEIVLTEIAFLIKAKHEGFTVLKLPDNLSISSQESMIKFLKSCGVSKKSIKTILESKRNKGWPNFDFVIMKGGKALRVEGKSLWGTHTDKARLIHSLGDDWKTSSCKFKDQDIFAVNLWLRTGKILDFGFAVSVLEDKNHTYGLPPATKRGNGEKRILKEYVHQNPECVLGDGKWFSKLEDVWNLCWKK